MNHAALIAAAGMLAAGAYIVARQDAQQASSGDTGGDWLGSAEGILTDATQNTIELLDTLTMGTLRLSNMAGVTAQDVAHQNVRALLATIRRGEGTAGEAGYRTLFGGATFDSFADHPRQSVTKKLGGKPITSTAAGAYQFLASTWDETARIMGLRDFSPAAQDRAAVGRIAARGALDDAKAGRLELALQKIGREWASMPGSPYGQPVITLQTAQATFRAAGGSVST